VQMGIPCPLIILDIDATLKHYKREQQVHLHKAS
jgi:hypothetical protein